MPTPTRILCSELGYPMELALVLEEVTDAVQRAYPKLHSLTLCGSVATGDFLWRERDGRIELLSDIDGFVFADVIPA